MALWFDQRPIAAIKHVDFDCLQSLQNEKHVASQIHIAGITSARCKTLQVKSNAIIIPLTISTGAG